LALFRFITSWQFVKYRFQEVVSEFRIHFRCLSYAGSSIRYFTRFRWFMPNVLGCLWCKRCIVFFS